MTGRSCPVSTGPPAHGDPAWLTGVMINFVVVFGVLLLITAGVGAATRVGSSRPSRSSVVGRGTPRPVTVQRLGCTYGCTDFFRVSESKPPRTRASERDRCPLMSMVIPDLVCRLTSRMSSARDDGQQLVALTLVGRRDPRRYGGVVYQLMRVLRQRQFPIPTRKLASGGGLNLTS